MAEQLEYAGFHKLRPGRIHMICPKCGRKQSNMPRCDEIEPRDPPTATLVGAWCERCSDGCKVEGPDFYRDAEGRELCQMCGRHDCDSMGGERECDENLIYAAQPDAVSVAAVFPGAADEQDALAAAQPKEEP